MGQIRFYRHFDFETLDWDNFLGFKIIETPFTKVSRINAGVGFTLSLIQKNPKRNS